MKYYRKCDWLIGNTRSIVDYAVGNGWPHERIDYLPNFVPDARMAAASLREELIASRGLAPLVLALGRLHPNKGFDCLLEALAVTKNANLWLAGEGPLRSRLERLATRLGIAKRVRFLGWRYDVPALMASALWSSADMYSSRTAARARSVTKPYGTEILIADGIAGEEARPPPSDGEPGHADHCGQ